MSPASRVLLVEPYFGGSHRAWAEGVARHSRHDVTLVTHEARFWKWRMEGAHVTLAEQAVSELDGLPPDVVLASSMLHLPAFLGAARRIVADSWVALYMHENQLTYPASHRQAEDLTHAMINWSSALAADVVVFNSEFHRTAFLSAVPELLGRFPDHRHGALVERVAAKSTVVPVGIDLVPPTADPGDPPLVLWNQRWEHDKAPEEMFAALVALAGTGREFQVAVCGEQFANEHPAFEAGREALGHRVAHFGFAEPDRYRGLLAQADIVLSTARHEFFGVAVLEAIAAQAFPVLPNGLVYPEHIPSAHREVVLYDDAGGLGERLAWAIDHRAQAAEVARELAAHVAARYAWPVVGPRYDEVLNVSW